MKKKGSALVFSVLMLSFFLAISLNIFFQARKKAERAGVKVSGERITNNIDMASSLGYQELLLAENFVRTGFPYDNSHPVYSEDFDPYTSTTGDRTKLYLLEDGFYTKKYPGIQINNFIDFFSSQWVLGDLSDQKIIIGEDIVGGTPLRRMWQSSGLENKLVPLWSPSATGRSIGGYTIKIAPTLPTSETSEPHPVLTAVYEKFIRLDKVTSGSILIPESVFRVEVTEEFTYSIPSSGVPSVSDRNITSFIVESVK